MGDGAGAGDEDVGLLDGVEARGDADAEDEAAGGENLELGSVVGLNVGVGLGLGVGLVFSLGLGLTMCSCLGWTACFDLKLDLNAALTECCMRIADGSA